MLTTIVVKFVPSWIPGVDFKRRMLETRGYVEKLKNIPFDRLREERVNMFLIVCQCLKYKC